VTIIGTGRLTWHPQERIYDRYGYVYLITRGDSTTVSCPTGSDMAEMGVFESDLGTLVTLKALVLENRKSTHVGDLFHKVYPETPAVGETITLGTGLLSATDEGVGLTPLDGRPKMWLDIRALYRAHEQTVRLFYEPAGTVDAAGVPQ
jgi:hypothetical protein